MSIYNDTTNTHTFFCNPSGARQLAKGFEPGKFDVICARGKLAHESEGNRRFRALVKHFQADYASCTCKVQKSKVVTHIVNTVRNASPDGGFVKIIDGEYWEAGDRAAKEKVGQTFRDLLHNKYSSSTKAKARARQERRGQPQVTMHLNSNTSVVSEDSFSNQDDTLFGFSPNTAPQQNSYANGMFQSQQHIPLMDALLSSIHTIDPRRESVLCLRESQRDALLRSSLQTIEESQKVLQSMLQGNCVCIPSIPTVNTTNTAPLLNIEIDISNKNMSNLEWDGLDFDFAAL